jgi:urease accessory protein
MHMSTKLLAALFLSTMSSAAFAHPGHGVSGFAAGLLHPFSGLDHLLAMVAVGLWAAQCGGRKIWLLPATFMTTLAAGAALAMHWQALPMVEAGIASSVLALGLLVALSRHLPALFSIGITALFGFFHGYAHGLELPESVAPISYATGFLIATATLHLSGIAAGITMQKYHAGLSRTLGIAIAACGAYLLAGV